jgi:hypothetical protein
VSRNPTHLLQVVSARILYSRNERHLATLEHGEATTMSQHSPERPRVSAAVLRADCSEVLMVQHRRPDGTAFFNHGHVCAML